MLLSVRCGNFCQKRIFTVIDCTISVLSQCFIIKGNKIFQSTQYEKNI